MPRHATLFSTPWPFLNVDSNGELEKGTSKMTCLNVCQLSEEYKFLVTE